MRVIDGFSLASRPILEREGAVVCILESSVIVGVMEETAVHACVPSLWISAEACVASAG